MSKSHSPSLVRSFVARALLAVPVVAALSACGESKPVGAIGYVKGFGGMAVADDPRAALAARDILSAGGTAADAAVSMYFTMAVTQPATASLGGGGACMIFSKDRKKVEALDFIAPPSASSGQIPTAVPANVRGFYALHAKYGKFRWEQLLNDPERLARTGVPVSRALAADLVRAGQMIGNDPAMRRIFVSGGQILTEGQTLTQTDLATTLSWIRRAPGDLYVGAHAREVAEGASRAGGSLSLDDLRDMRPAFRDALTVVIGEDTAFFAPPPATGSASAAQITAELAGRWKNAEAEERPHLLLEASARSMADRSRWMLPNGWDKTGNSAALSGKTEAEALMKDYSPSQHVPVTAGKSNDAIPAATFAALDSYGNAVACGVTTYGLFGVGRMIPNTGIILAGSPGTSAGPAAVSPILVANTNAVEFRLALTASGGVTAGSSAANVLLATLVENKSLDAAIAAPRIHHSGQPDLAFTESGDRIFDPAPLVKRGHEVKPVALPSRVNGMLCRSGTANFNTCSVVTDPRGFGLAQMVGRD